MFTSIGNYALGVALLSLLFCTPAQATKLEVGSGVFCDTQQQMERFVALLDGDQGAAIKAVNAEEHNPTACGTATIAYVRGPQIATARTKAGTFNIVRVLVIGVLTETGFKAAVPVAFYSAEPVDERVA
jgi:hypothetical protein